MRSVCFVCVCGCVRAGVCHSSSLSLAHTRSPSLVCKAFLTAARYNERQSNAQFDYNRKQLLDTIGVEVHRSAKAFDKETEALKFTSIVRSTLFQTLAITGAGALGLGAVLSASLLDFTGLLGASVVAVGGLCIIPYKRRVVKKEFLTKVGSLSWT